VSNVVNRLTTPASASNRATVATKTEWLFRLSSDPVTTDEQERFVSDLDHLGVGRSVWNVFNTTLQSKTPHSRPLVLRGYEGDSLIGVALVYECRKTGECFFDPPVSTFMDMPGLPMFVWLRYGITVDHFANPGFVAEGVDRDRFVEHAIARLLREYLYGTVIEYTDSPVLDGAVRFPFVDTGIIDLEGFSAIEDYLGRSKNLPRKLKKFRNKGGEIRIIEGAIPPDLKAAALDAFGTLDISVRTPFQDNYLNMAGAGMSLDAPEMVHFVALLNDEYAGHQSFCRSGRAIHCQAGAFDRRQKSTYHAYENIIVSSVEYALEHNLDRIDYGPVINETKAKMMTGFIPCENRTYARYRPIAAALPLMLSRSKLSAEKLQPWVNLGEKPTLMFV
jgi:hypothetical protein